MAYTKTPTQSTYETKTVPLLYKWDSRDSSAGGYDTQMKNALVEPIGEEYFQVMKRNGAEPLTLTPPLGATEVVVGMYYWVRPSDTVLVLVVKGIAGTGKVYLVNTTTMIPLAVALPIATLLTVDVEVNFTEFLYQNGTVDLLINVQGQLYKIDPSNIMTNITPGVITSLGVSIVYLDGYAFAHDKANIWNSNLNDPTTWSASNFLAADSYPDQIARIARVGPYIVAFGSESVQYFYDAANPTGTPLAANVGATKRVGYLGGYANYGDDVLFIGTANQGTAQLYRLSGLKQEAVVSAPFSRMWTTQASLYTAVYPAPPGSILNLNGHSCYFVRTPSTPYAFPDDPPNVPVADTYFYDLETGYWSKIGYQATEFYLIKQAVTFATKPTIGSGSPRKTYFCVLGNNQVHSFSPTIYQDDSVNFEVKFRTKPWDFGTFRTKFGGRLLIQGDQTSASSLAYVSWSDDDYKTTSTPRSIDMVYAYQQMYGLGAFRKRSFTFTYSDNFPMRWKSIELDYDQGSA